MEFLYNTTRCMTGQLQLLSDTAPVYDASNGTLRVPIVIKNVGTTAFVAPTRIFFNADSSQFLGPEGQILPGKPDIVATNFDTTMASGRAGWWRYDTLLSAGAPPQILAPGASTRRKWLMFAGTSWTQLVRLKLPTMATLATEVVPALPPDSTPRAYFSNRQNWITNPPYISATIIRDVLEVYFRMGSSQSARQSAIESVLGNVVGGARMYPDGDGVYYVRIPVSAVSLSVAKAMLEANPAVEMVAFITLGGLRDAYVLPVDGPGWKRTDWSASPVAAAGSNWALERIRAPLAWGCATGTSTTLVAAVDNGFHVSRDLSTIGGNPLFGALALDSIAHGTRVASVIGASGNNGDLISGVMWTAALRLYERTADVYGTLNPGLPPDSLPDQTPYWVSRAAMDGAQVINISVGRAWPLWSLIGQHPSTQPIQFGDANASIYNDAWT